MVGTKQRRFAPLIKVSVEELVPQDHFYRHLERTLDNEPFPDHSSLTKLRTRYGIEVFHRFIHLLSEQED